jgi:peptidoglycan/xylan/chitin deacetylase (PgdA/CDA1 family)
VLHADAGCAAKARNIGLDAATGGFVLFLDADDWIAPPCLERMVSALEASPQASVVYCAYQRVTPQGRLTAPKWSGQIAGAPQEFFARRFDSAIHCFLARRTIVAQVGGFDPTLRTCEDWDLWRRTALTGAVFVGIADVLAFYRMSSQSLTADRRQLIHDAMTVLGRGFGSAEQPRPAGDSALHKAWFSLWCAVAGIGADREDVALLDLTELRLDWSAHFGGTVDLVIDALIAGAACTAAELAPHWPQFAPALDRLFGRLAAHSRDLDLARRLAYAVECRIARASPPGTQATLTRILIHRTDVSEVEPLFPESAVELAIIRFCSADDLLASVELPILGDLPADSIARAAVEAVGYRELLKQSIAHRRTAFDARMLLNLLPTPGRVRAARGAGGRRRMLRSYVGRALTAAMIRPRMQPALRATSEEVLSDIVKRAEKLAESIPLLPIDPLKGAGRSITWTGDMRRYWEDFFAEPDPWGYSSEYEARKYQRTIAMISGEPFRNALELACAEGHFTELLAPMVEHLTASDISERALQRAAKRCANQSNIAFRPLDFINEELPAGLDLLTCSEVLYFLDNEAALRVVAAKFREALRDGGVLVTAHALLLKDDRSRTGFDWPQAFGAETIARAFSQTPGLHLEKTMRTELYRIDRYRRHPIGASVPATVVEEVPLLDPLEPEVARHVVWGGTDVLREEARRSETTRTIPVLAYHRIAAAGPPAIAHFRVSPGDFADQLRALRRAGFYSLGTAELQEYIHNGTPVPGRPIVITFDDGYADFITTAWPILQAHDFEANVFVPTSLVGGRADWDAEHGEAAPLMGWHDIMRMAASGVRFGSHLARHRRGDALTTHELAQELAQSRAVLGTYVNQDIRMLAAPYGAIDERFVRLAAQCGYGLGFSTEQGFARLTGAPLALPRITVSGSWSIGTFRAALNID